MSSPAHYRFIADIYLKNASNYTVAKLHDVCSKIFSDKQSKRRSNKYWTNRRITYYESTRSIIDDSLLRFEIEDAETVRELKRIEEQLRVALAEKPFRNVVKSVECRHVRTK